MIGFICTLTYLLCYFCHISYSKYKTDVQPDVPLKEAWKFIFGSKLSKLYTVTLVTDGNGSILTIELEFENEDSELQKLIEIKPEAFQNRQNVRK